MLKFFVRFIMCTFLPSLCEFIDCQLIRCDAVRFWQTFEICFLNDSRCSLHSQKLNPLVTLKTETNETIKPKPKGQRQNFPNNILKFPYDMYSLVIIISGELSMSNCITLVIFMLMLVFRTF